MCLGIPGQIVDRTEGPLPMATLEFAGTRRQVSLMYVPEAQVGEWVFIQQGHAMEVIAEADARAALETMREFDLLAQPQNLA
ncbi:MAG: HypC/HybG/HupF family hydrogenase formation chaperone [Corynebacterium sp.]|nr:HypC/HybG/HupF family hydrogenase formation chaperone [Corynebacterium sp.]